MWCFVTTSALSGSISDCLFYELLVDTCALCKLGQQIEAGVSNSFGTAYCFEGIKYEWSMVISLVVEVNKPSFPLSTWKQRKREFEQVVASFAISDQQNSILQTALLLLSKLKCGLAIHRKLRQFTFDRNFSMCKYCSCSMECNDRQNCLKRA